MLTNVPTYANARLRAAADCCMNIDHIMSCHAHVCVTCVDGRIAATHAHTCVIVLRMYISMCTHISIHRARQLVYAMPTFCRTRGRGSTATNPAPPSAACTCAHVYIHAHPCIHIYIYIYIYTYIFTCKHMHSTQTHTHTHRRATSRLPRAKPHRLCGGTLGAAAAPTERAAKPTCACMYACMYACMHVCVHAWQLSPSLYPHPLRSRTHRC